MTGSHSLHSVLQQQHWLGQSESCFMAPSLSVPPDEPSTCTASKKKKKKNNIIKSHPDMKAKREQRHKRKTERTH